MYFNHAFRKSFLPKPVAALTPINTATLGTTTGRVLQFGAATTGVTAGMSVSGTGIAPGTVVTGFGSPANSVTLSQPITALVPSGTTITFGSQSSAITFNTSTALNAPNVLQFAPGALISVVTGMSVTGLNIPTGTTVTDVTTTLVTLSNSVTGTVPTGTGITFGQSISVLSTGSTASLTEGQIGFFTPSGTALQTASSKPFIIAQGSYFTSDKIGGNKFLGGYQESIKSKTINPHYISRVIKISAAQPANQIKEFSLKNTECGKTYNFRMDLKGSPALRLLSHNIYRTMSAFSGCFTDDCTATCTGALVDPTTIIIKWAQYIVNDPILSQFVTLQVINYESSPVTITQAGTSAAQIATFLGQLATYSPATPWDPNAVGAATFESFLKITAAYEDTKFGNCTFTPTDFYELMPLLVYGSMVDESGDPCNVQGFAQTVPDPQAPVQASGVGETVLREMILDGRYLQNAYPDSTRVDSLRMREIEADPALATINRNGFYDQVLVLHSVPRFNNPTGTFDNDQYLLKFHVPAGVSTTALTNYVVAAANAAQGAGTVSLETY
jgi:hypothetical protein